VRLRHARFAATSRELRQRQPHRPNADTNLQVGFAAGAGSLAGAPSTGEVQARFNKNDFSNYNENNDYSYDPTRRYTTG